LRGKEVRLWKQLELEEGRDMGTKLKEGREGCG